MTQASQVSASAAGTVALGDLTARTLKFGLDLLGINVIDRM